jgi:hypothetical protein
MAGIGMSQTTRPTSARKDHASPVVTPQPDSNLSTHIVEQAFPVLAVYLCGKGIIENIAGFRWVSDFFLRQIDQPTSGAPHPGVQSEITLLASVVLLVLILFFAWGEHIKNHQLHNAKIHLDVVVTSTFIVLAGLLGVSFR